MYRILLADDEGIMLESLKSIISSNYGNECEIHTAKTGRAVVEEAEKYPPDICFMDIQMPGLSGIQAIREIQKFNRSVVFVIITAYDKFNYAKEAVNLGVMEFLTKPVNKKVILETCSKAMDQVDSTRQKRSDDLKIREKLETVVPMIESGYINNILLQDDFQTYQDNYKELLDIQEEYGYMIVAEFGDSTENGVLTNAVGASVKANKFYSTFREIAQGFFECLVGPIMGNRIVILVPYRNPKESYEERVEVVTRTRNMVHKLESRIDSKFRCGIGRVKELGSTMKESFKEAMIALRESTSHVIQVLAENQLAGQVIVVGQDGDLAACQRIVEGTQYMTAFKSIEDLARQAARYAVKMAEEGKVSSDVTDTVNDGSYDVPAKVLEPVAVTRDNIDEVIIDGGFHRRDEVYLNTDYDTE